MTQKQQLEILCGHEIATKLPLGKVPCLETSDADRLCRRPVVSVCMLAYNHESYIGKAIESALNQITDFDYEIVISEDCSTDRTREICFEYQRKYPEKIRVLWSENNLFKVGGNLTRLMGNCRGEYYAILEGDDCWLDVHKLQKQVDVMRRHPNVGLCIGGGVIHNVVTGADSPWTGVLFREGLMTGEEVRHQIIFKSYKVKQGTSVLTASAMMRRTYYKEAEAKFDIHAWNLSVGDVLWWLSMASVADVYCTFDRFAQYNVHPGSASSSPSLNLEGDSAAIKAYFALRVDGKRISDLQPMHRYLFACNLIRKYAGCDSSEQRNSVRELLPFVKVFSPVTQITLLFLKMGVLRSRNSYCLMRLAGYVLKYGRWIS